MKKFNIAVIGFGFMGKTHSYSFSSIPFYYENAQAVACLHTIMSRDIKKAQAVKEKYGFLKATDCYESVIADDSVDVVDICTPNLLHYEQIKAAINAGKHVYCDKPLAATYLQAKELSELAKTKGVLCGMTFQNRCWPAVTRAKQLIDEGRIGDIVTFRAAYLHSSLTDKNKPYSWRLSPIEEGGGVIMDLGTHVIDLVTYLLGNIDSVKAVLQRATDTRPDGRGGSVNIECDDAAYMTAVLKNGAVGTIEASKLALGINDSLRIEAHGTKGAFKFDLVRPGELLFFDNGDADGVYGGESGFKTIDCLQKYPEPCSFLNGKIQPGWIRAHIHSAYNFIDALNRGVTPSPSFDDGVEAQRVIELARESHN